MGKFERGISRVGLYISRDGPMPRLHRDYVSARVGFRSLSIAALNDKLDSALAHAGHALYDARCGS